MNILLKMAVEGPNRFEEDLKWAVPKWLKEMAPNAVSVPRVEAPEPKEAKFVKVVQLTIIDRILKEPGGIRSGSTRTVGRPRKGGLTGQNKSIWFKETLQESFQTICPPPSASIDCQGQSTLQAFSLKKFIRESENRCDGSGRRPNYTRSFVR